jgi:magnesium transporter
MRYDRERLDEAEEIGPEEMIAQLQPGRVAWFDVQGLGDEKTLHTIGEGFGLSPLTLADVVNTPQRPKLEVFPEHTLIITRMILGQADHAVRGEQVSLLVGQGWVLTFQEFYGDCLEPVRQRIRANRGLVRQMGPDYLAYALLDAIIDGYYPILEDLGDVLEQMEAQVVADPDPALLTRIFTVRRTLMTIRHAMWPQRETLASLTRRDAAHFGEEVNVYLRDCYDHVTQIMDAVENYRELANGLVDAHLSASSNRMNEVMKVLTIIATIFIPLSFLAGVYGMNFEYMPELQWRGGYAMFWATAAAMAGVMLFYFKRRKWL